MLVNYISPVEFLTWTVLFTHILVVITDGSSEDESSDTDHLQTTGKNQVNQYISLNLARVCCMLLQKVMTYHFFCYCFTFLLTTLKDKAVT